MVTLRMEANHALKPSETFKKLSKLSENYTSTAFDKDLNYGYFEDFFFALNLSYRDLQLKRSSAWLINLNNVLFLKFVPNFVWIVFIVRT